MGMIIEFNWFMVVANENKILEEQENLFYDFWGILQTSTRIGICLAHVGIQPSFSVS